MFQVFILVITNQIICYFLNYTVVNFNVLKTARVSAIATPALELLDGNSASCVPLLLQWHATAAQEWTPSGWMD